MTTVLMFLALGFALFAAPVAVAYPHKALSIKRPTATSNRWLMQVLCLARCDWLIDANRIQLTFSQSHDRCFCCGA
jgi:hypothetical protein